MNTDTSNLSQLQSLLGTSSGSDTGMSLVNTDAIMKSLMPLIIIGTVVSILITIAYLLNVVQHFRANRAIIETRDILREMNEREKAREAPAAPSPAPATQTAVDQ